MDTFTIGYLGYGVCWSKFCSVIVFLCIWCPLFVCDRLFSSCLSVRKMVKEKPNSIRIYDDEGFRRRAACICVRSDAETEVNASEDTVLHWNGYAASGPRANGVLFWCVGAVGDVVAASRQLDRAGRRSGAGRRALSDGDAGGARRSRRHRQARPLSRRLWGTHHCLPSLGNLY